MVLAKAFGFVGKYFRIFRSGHFVAECLSARQMKSTKVQNPPRYSRVRVARSACGPVLIDGRDHAFA